MRVVLVAAVLAWAGAAAGQGMPTGRWLTQDRDAVIAIEPCGTALCGQIVGITLDHPDDPTPVDNMGRPQCGLTIITGAVPDGEAWAMQILDPRNGAAYRARMHVDTQGRLQVRGFIGIPLLGRTQAWTPYAGVLTPDCILPRPSSAVP
ncbi:MAG: DUF2147 domain-containing protein [Gemmatimonadaceae bacterium]|nr:DUF2147 domain-containing protein [Acetobacteraceae bacterium]